MDNYANIHVLRSFLCTKSISSTMKCQSSIRSIFAHDSSSQTPDGTPKKYVAELPVVHFPPGVSCNLVQSFSHIRYVCDHVSLLQTFAFFALQTDCELHKWETRDATCLGSIQSRHLVCCLEKIFTRSMGSHIHAPHTQNKFS